jgi:hypothetical protein
LSGPEKCYKLNNAFGTIEPGVRICPAIDREVCEGDPDIGADYGEYKSRGVECFGELGKLWYLVQISAAICKGISGLRELREQENIATEVT